MKFKLTTILLMISVFNLLGQVDYIKEGLSYQFAPEEEERTMYNVVFQDDQYYFTGHESINGKGSVTKYDKATMKQVWRVNVEKSTLGKKKLTPIFLYHINTDVTHVVSESYNSKTANVELYHAAINGEGEMSEYNILATFRAFKKGDYQCFLRKHDNGVLIWGHTGAMKTVKPSVFTIWLDENNEFDKELSYPIERGAKYVESFDLDEKNERFYLTMHEGTIVGQYGKVHPPKNRYIFKFDRQKSSAISQRVEFEDLFPKITDVIVNQQTAEVYLVGFMGEKKGNSNSNTFYKTKISLEDLLFKEIRTYPISGKAIDELVTSKRSIENMFEDANSVSFNLKDCFFMEDGSSFIVYSNPVNFRGKGQLIVRFKNMVDLDYMKYYGNYSCRDYSIYANKQGGLSMFTLTNSLYLNDQEPNSLLKESDKKHYCLNQVDFNKDRTHSVEVLMNIDFSKDGYYIGSLIDGVEISKEPSILFLQFTGKMSFKDINLMKVEGPIFNYNNLIY